MAKWDVIVVGAGHNGLVAAAYLAQLGQRVLVLERRELVGGLCTTEELFPGFRGNKVANSPHNVDPVVVTELALERHGLRFIHPDPSAVMSFEDGRAYVSYATPDRRVEEIAKFSSADVEGFPRLNQYVSNLAETLVASFYEPPPSFRRLVSRVRTPSQEDAFRRIFFGTVEDLVNDFLEAEELKVSVAVMALLTNNVGPRSSGSSLPLMLRSLHYFSTLKADLDPTVRRKVEELGPNRWVPFGGMGSITAAIASSAIAAGATIRVGAEVDRVMVSHGRVSGVALAGGEEITAPVVVANVDPKIALLRFVPPDSLDPQFRATIERIPSVGDSAKVYLKLDGLPRFRCAASHEENMAFAKCNFRIAPTMEGLEADYQKVCRGLIPARPKIMGQIPSALDESLCPPGRHIMSLSVGHIPYHLADNARWKDAGARLASNVIESLRPHITNLDAILTDARVLTPEDLEREYALPGGQASHGDILPGSYFGFRPAPGWSDYRTPVSGLYLCGTGTWPGNFVSGLAGRNVSRAVADDLAAPLAAERAIRRRAAASVGQDAPVLAAV